MDTFEEKFSALLTPINVIAFIILVFIVFGGIIYSLVAFTPIKQYVIPDFTDYEYREDARYSRYMVDSLSQELEKKDRWINDLQTILSGGIVATPGTDTSSAPVEASMVFNMTEEDSILREKVAEEDRYDARIDPSVSSTLANLYLFRPLNGTLSSKFNAESGHYGIDVIAPENEVVKSVLDGTVILSTYTSDGGNVVQIQHSHNLISVYKHNSALFKETGDPVRAGESIAVIGNSGYHTDGPHLHFELWLDGVPIDPLIFLAYEE